MKNQNFLQIRNQLIERIRIWVKNPILFFDILADLSLDTLIQAERIRKFIALGNKTRSERTRLLMKRLLDAESFRSRFLQLNHQKTCLLAINSPKK